MSDFRIDNNWISLDQLDQLIVSKRQVSLSEGAKKRVSECRAYLDTKSTDSNELIYGVNTGFGSLCNTAIQSADLEQLQRNLVLSHACGTGKVVPDHIVKRMLLLKAFGLAHGNSGVQLETIERLLYFYNHDLLPVVYEQGSLGASGDLAPLAHLSLALIGEGEMRVNGVMKPAREVLNDHQLEPIALRSKEGLALLNGTQFMSAYASYAIQEAKKIWTRGTWIAGLSLDAYDGRQEPFQKNVNEIRNQIGQIETATLMRQLLEGSEMINAPKVHVQDPYSFRCIPQVHGASKDAIDYCATIVEREINAVTDNPTIFMEEDQVVSAGNFHGQPLAISMDFLAIALAELGSISERRIYKLISGTRGLPAFLVSEPGLNSGFMITQYTAASIASQNRQLCTPASVDSIDSSNGQEDHVSMGANAATKLYRVVENCYGILGIELLCAAQAMDFRSKRSSVKLEEVRTAYRSKINFVQQDTYMHPLIQESIDFVQNSTIFSA